MSPKKWNNLDTEARIKYLKDHKVHTRSQGFADKRSIVGEPGGINRKYQGMIGKLPVGKWHDDEEDAIADAQTFKAKAD